MGQDVSCHFLSNSCHQRVVNVFDTSDYHGVSLPSIHSMCAQLYDSMQLCRCLQTSARHWLTNCSLNQFYPVLLLSCQNSADWPWRHIPVIPALMRLRQEDQHKFEVNLVYILSSDASQRFRVRPSLRSREG